MDGSDVSFMLGRLPPTADYLARSDEELKVKLPLLIGDQTSCAYGAKICDLNSGDGRKVGHMQKKVGELGC
jgi:hypothetical protein